MENISLHVPAKILRGFIDFALSSGFRPSSSPRQANAANNTSQFSLLFNRTQFHRRILLLCIILARLSLFFCLVYLSLFSIISLCVYYMFHSLPLAGDCC
jgi:hypothetical protein